MVRGLCTYQKSRQSNMTLSNYWKLVILGTLRVHENSDVYLPAKNAPHSKKSTSSLNFFLRYCRDNP